MPIRLYPLAQAEQPATARGLQALMHAGQWQLERRGRGSAVARYAGNLSLNGEEQHDEEVQRAAEAGLQQSLQEESEGWRHYLIYSDNAEEAATAHIIGMASYRPAQKLAQALLSIALPAAAKKLGLYKPIAGSPNSVYMDVWTFDPAETPDTAEYSPSFMPTFEHYKEARSSRLQHFWTGEYKHTAVSSLINHIRASGHDGSIWTEIPDSHLTAREVITLRNAGFYTSPPGRYLVGEPDGMYVPPVSRIHATPVAASVDQSSLALPLRYGSQQALHFKST